MALFPGPPWWAGARRELLDFMVQGKINRRRHADNPDGRHSIRTSQCPPPPSPIFYRPDTLPAAPPTVSKHWRQLYLTYSVSKKILCSLYCSVYICWPISTLFGTEYIGITCNTKVIYLPTSPAAIPCKHLFLVFRVSDVVFSGNVWEYTVIFQRYRW